MSWVTVIWSMIAATCLTLAGVHLLVWVRNRAALNYLAFALAALSMAGVAVVEFLLMRATTPEAIGTVLRWSNVPLTLMITGILWFVHVTFRTGRAWLAYTAVGLRLVAQVLHFTTGQTIMHREIISLRKIEYLGEPVSVIANAVSNPWAWVLTLSNLAMVAYLVDAALRLWRFSGPGQRARAAWLGCSLVGFVLLSSGMGALINIQVDRVPYFISIPFVAILMVMSHELGSSLLRSQQIERDLQQSESHLRASENQLKLAADAADLGFWSWNLQNDAFWATERTKVILGFTPSSRVTFAMVRAQLHRDDRTALEDGIAEAVSGKGGYRVECRLLRPDGQVSWISIRGNLAADSTGKPAAITGIVIDISERRRSELEIAEQRNELAHLSRVNMLGELSGSLAHELNQPLTAILSNAQAAQKYLASDSVDLKEVREILTDIVAEDKRAGEIIRGLRSLLKRGEEQSLRLNVNELVVEVLKLMRSDLVNQGVTVRTALTPELPLVPGDRVQFQQILINLVMNACDAMSEVVAAKRQVQVVTRLESVGVVLISVSDRGTGIDPGKLERIFEPFYTNKPAGMGLGLAVCRTIVTAHGGRLWAGNNPDGGAAIHFTLPVQRPARTALVAAGASRRVAFSPAGFEPWAA